MSDDIGDQFSYTRPTSTLSVRCQFENACIKGHLHVAKWLLSKYPHITNSETTFRDSCANGHLEVAQWIYSLPHGDFDLSDHRYLYHALFWACMNGHLEVAKWLHSLNEELDISSKKEYFLVNVCGQGTLDVVKWLLSVKPGVDISADNEEAFLQACENGRLCIAQWLLFVKPDINISSIDHFAFKNSCSKSCINPAHLFIAEWLVSVKPFLYKIKFDANGFAEAHIRIKEDERWQERKMAVWLRTGTAKAKNNAFAQVPQDVSRYIVQMFL